jgi:ribosome-binding protein aMBF1 (putative translation factor)
MYAKDILTQSWHKCHMSRNKKVNAKKILEKFGDALRKARLDKGLSQERLALDAGLDLTSINEIERGHRSPKLITVFKIANGLDIEPASLLKGI